MPPQYCLQTAASRGAVPTRTKKTEKSGPAAAIMQPSTDNRPEAEDDELVKRKARAARFGIPVVEPQSPKTNTRARSAVKNKPSDVCCIIPYVPALVTNFFRRHRIQRSSPHAQGVSAPLAQSRRRTTRLSLVRKERPPFLWMPRRRRGGESAQRGLLPLSIVILIDTYDRLRRTVPQTHETFRA
jgi:hypothetical protein